MTATTQPTADPADDPLRSVHTATFPGLLAELQSSLIVSTYQAGKLILVRNENGALNTHFRRFARPMGMAVDDQRMAIGGAQSVWSLSQSDRGRPEARSAWNA